MYMQNWGNKMILAGLIATPRADATVSPGFPATARLVTETILLSLEL